MELHQVRYFVNLARTLNFTRAAEQCNVTQPALTKAIQKLELELGGELVYRERQLTQLTDLGHLVLATLEQLLAAAETARNKAKEYYHKDVAILRIGLSRTVSGSMLVEPVAQLSRTISGLEIEIIELGSKGVSDALLEGEIHAAVADSVQLDELRVDRLPLFEERYIALMGTTHTLAKAPTIALEALMKTPILARSIKGVSEFYNHDPLRCLGDAHPKHRGMQEGHLQFMAAAGLGVMLSPESSPRLAELVAVPIEGDPIWRSVDLFVMAGRCYSPALKAFIQIMRRADWTAALQRRSQAFNLEGFQDQDGDHATLSPSLTDTLRSNPRRACEPRTFCERSLGIR